MTSQMSDGVPPLSSVPALRGKTIDVASFSSSIAQVVQLSWPKPSLEKGSGLDMADPCWGSSNRVPNAMFGSGDLVRQTVPCLWQIVADSARKRPFGAALRDCCSSSK